MIEFVLNTEVNRAFSRIFGNKDKFFDTLNLEIYKPQVFIQTGNALLYLINEKISVPQTARVIIRSKNNLLITSAASYNPNLNIKPFRGYLEIITENSGTEFVPFTLTFLKVMPYE